MKKNIMIFICLSLVICSIGAIFINNEKTFATQYSLNSSDSENKILVYIKNQGPVVDAITTTDVATIWNDGVSNFTSYENYPAPTYSKNSIVFIDWDNSKIKKSQIKEINLRCSDLLYKDENGNPIYPGTGETYESFIKKCQNLELHSFSGWGGPDYYNSLGLPEKTSLTEYVLSDEFEGLKLWSDSYLFDKFYVDYVATIEFVYEDSGVIKKQEIKILYDSPNGHIVRFSKGQMPSNTDPDINNIVNKTYMYRLYNPNSGEHFYTANVHERDYLIPLGWKYEGIGWIAPSNSNTPVFRLYNPNSGDHHYTINKEERDWLISLGWNYEGIGWYSDDAKGVPLYRQYNPNETIGTHNYTTNKDENDWLVSLGWRAEGIGWYGMTQ